MASCVYGHFACASCKVMVVMQAGKLQLQDDRWWQATVPQPEHGPWNDIQGFTGSVSTCTRVHAVAQSQQHVSLFFRCYT